MAGRAAFLPHALKLGSWLRYAMVVLVLLLAAHHIDLDSILDAGALSEMVELDAPCTPAPQADGPTDHPAPAPQMIVPCPLTPAATAALPPSAYAALHVYAPDRATPSVALVPTADRTIPGLSSMSSGSSLHAFLHVFLN